MYFVWPQWQEPRRGTRCDIVGDVGEKVRGRRCVLVLVRLSESLFRRRDYVRGMKTHERGDTTGI